MTVFCSLILLKFNALGVLLLERKSEMLASLFDLLPCLFSLTLNTHCQAQVLSVNLQEIDKFLSFLNKSTDRLTEAKWYSIIFCNYLHIRRYVVDTHHGRQMSTHKKTQVIYYTSEWKIVKKYLTHINTYSTNRHLESEKNWLLTALICLLETVSLCSHY